MRDKEYIERGALVDFLKKEIEQCENDLAESCGDDRYEQAVDSRMTAFLEVLRRAESKPAADVVEVVRCKDCKHWTPMDDGISWNNRGRADGRCKMLENMHYSERGLTNENHFCSYGERKEQT